MDVEKLGGGANWKDLAMEGWLENWLRWDGLSSRITQKKKDLFLIELNKYINN